jgi:trehalose/maltose hydrolase-like predicted phosphorylase
MALYDNISTISLDMTSNLPYDKGLFLGNGKIGLFTSSNMNASSSLITASMTAENAKYITNVIETFNPYRVAIGNSNIALNQQLDMNTGIFTLDETSLYSNATITSSLDIYAARNLPFTSIQTFRINTNSNVVLPIYHYMSCKSNIQNPVFNNNVIYDTTPIYLQTGVGQVSYAPYFTTPTSVTMATACSYIFEGSNDSLGFNKLTDYSDATAFSVFNIHLVAGTTYRFHIISTFMTSDDFINPLDECKRVSLNAISRGITAIRVDHVNQWSSLWAAGDVQIIPKTGITQLELDEINKFKRYIKTALYNIYAVVRGNVNLDVNATSLGYMDYVGNGMYSGEMSFIPLLLILKSDLAKSILDYRYKTLNLAIQLAAGYGFRGCKYPYEDDNLGYKNSLYWTTNSTLTIFNTAIITMHLWNYYRVTKDLEWLRTIGYPIMKSAADFFTSVILDETPFDPLDPCSCYGNVIPTLSINNVNGLAGRLSAKNNAFTNGLVKNALRYAIESSYEINANVPEIWNEFYQYLNIPMDTTVIKFDDTTATTTYLSLPIIEPLALFIPYYGEELVRYNQNANLSLSGSLKSTMNVYIGGSNFGSNIVASGTSNLSAYTSSNPVSLAIAGSINAIYSQTDSTFVQAFNSNINDFLTNNVGSNTWGQFKDVAVGSHFVNMFVQGLTQTTPVGGVAPTRFYYNELGLTNLTSANMPKSWKTILIKANGTSYITNNIMYYQP